MDRCRVYVGAIQNLNEKIKYSFCDPTMGRMLVLASKKPDGSFRAMTKKEHGSLSDKECIWLSQTRFVAAMNNTSQTETATEFAQNMNKLMDLLEEELRKEKEAMTDGTEKQQSEISE